ncbi:phosphoribosylanthranilate isomerase [Haladaptatus litoreus]|uniref:N-(5'-phosphoribosyl)anthranilate isomerase n=1 Tax=Haladaptatus litoreus TaxID=553468 RepID=A0A1N6ZUN4_9EURY|nr:phosphoribosylanthranilate isomerase [Haladaptatus litoreus]SIR30466.1 phosphoribosylanthranilate isomerase [Haladaptatus litoreus]
MTRAKICGLTAEDDLRAAVSVGADAIGLLVDVPVDSPREIDPLQAAELAREVPPFVTTVLVTMPETPERAVELAEIIEPDAVQVHGMGVGDLAYLSSSIDGNVIRAIDAKTENPERYDTVADALLLDAGKAGGTGETHDWERAREFANSLDSPVILAGGLNPDNVADAVEAVEPFAVDVASGVESGGGQKDHSAVESFVRNAKLQQMKSGPVLQR